MDRTPNAYASFMGGIPEVVTTRQMRAVEAAAIGSGAVTGRALMERAGAAAAGGAARATAGADRAISRATAAAKAR